MSRNSLWLYVQVLLLLNLLALPGAVQEIETKTPGADFDFPVEFIEDIDLSRQYAFFIGINIYKNIKDLDNPVEDCKTIETLLDDRYGFENIEHLENHKATKEAIEAKFQAYQKRLTRDDVLFIYFSGHGYKTDPPGEKVYWIPENVGADLNRLGYRFDKESDADNKTVMSSSDIKISDSYLKDFMKNCQARHIFAVMDSCHSSILFKKIEEEPHFIPTPDLWNKTSRQLLAAGDRVFDGIKDRYSPFAAAFISILQREEPGYKYVGASTIIAEIKKKFELQNKDKKDKQTPDGGRVYGAGDNEGEFYFYLKYEVLAAQTTANYKKLKKFIHQDRPSPEKLTRCREFLNNLKLLPNKFLELKSREIISIRKDIEGFIKENEKP
jgi:uncharacterized caspase-like protein